MSASGPGDRIASTRDVAIYFREDCRTLRDSLQLEMVAAQYCVQVRDVRSAAGVPVGEPVGAGVVAELEGHGDPLSRAVLTALAHVGVGEVAARSAEAAARLDERGVGLPEQFGDVAAARAIGAWWSDEGAFPGQYVLFADFEHPSGRRHGTALFVERADGGLLDPAEGDPLDPVGGGVLDIRDGGFVKHIGLLSAVSDFDPDEPFHPSTLEQVPIPVAGRLMSELFDRTYGPDAEDSDDFRVLIARARAAAMAREGAPARSGRGP